MLNLQLSDKIADYIFPVVIIKSAKIDSFLGTAFMIGKNGFALTAHHILNQTFEKDSFLAGIFVNNYEYVYFQIINYEKHPVEDVALLKISSFLHTKTIFQVSESKENSSFQYKQFCYPSITMSDIVFNGKFSDLPDLIYIQGYFRRRFTDKLGGYWLNGKSFYELSSIANEGSSGSPIFRLINKNKEYWDIVAIYLGEKTYGNNITVAVSVRTDAFYDWIPQILGKKIIEEANS